MKALLRIFDRLLFRKEGTAAYLQIIDRDPDHDAHISFLVSILDLSGRIGLLDLDCTPDSGQLVKQQYLRQSPFRTVLEIYSPKLNVTFYGCTPFQ